ncbi:hypothetical protein P171DRAFT_506370 [Karstenula rhodostoma CBS 690.94]|uniref:Amidoligase enzyme n=1 Tax=Karstenula rhodostoma CBS 690.94 TaxID=1392251 RepID=A0A9P4P4Q0_9PLEO|nr:hypothetical protein P171DRAFT_506370 [Karstenula rhodostoma CBS 690.94]
MAPAHIWPSLTFGVELEFICVYKEDAFVKLAQYLRFGSKVDRNKVRHVEPGHAIWYKLNEAGIEAGGWGNDEVPAVDPYSSWSVFCDDLELTGTEQDCVPGYLEDPLELSSPVFNLGDEESFQQIERVLQVLASMEDDFDCMFVSNISCGLHVHIGCGKGTVIPLPVAKRVFQLTTAHEHNFDALHAASRILAPVNSKDFYTISPYIPLSFFHRNGRLGSGNYNVFDWLQSIEESRSNGDLSRFFQLDWGGETFNGHWATVNFDNLFLSEESEFVPRTIEFRQHVGTLDFAEISRYVHLIGNVFNYCYQADDDHFFELLVKATDTKFTVEHLMHAVSGPAHNYASITRKISQSRCEVDSAHFAVSRYPLCPLDALKDQNSREVRANHNSRSMNEIRAHKLETGLYGLNQSPRALRVHPDAISEMIVKAAGSLLASTPDVRFDELSSQARAIAFGKLARMYRDLGSRSK